MSGTIQAIRGMNDILPEQIGSWQKLEQLLKSYLDQFGYEEIRCPVLEQTALFKRSIGDVTDIVEKEMYTFEDRNGDQLSLRPEGTAQVVRSVLEHNLLYGQTPRLWSIGPMFRHERPQKGRYRQFYQCSVEVFGMEGPDIDVELILLSYTILKACGLEKNVRLTLNTLGTAESRKAYRDLLVEYFTRHKAQLDEDSLRRLESNPLRILDSKNPDMAEVITGAPKLTDSLDEASTAHFEKLQKLLTAAGVPYEVNPRLVRGLDYYSKTVFEWVTNDLGAQGTVIGGGRYDGLLTQLGSKQACPAAGFSIGLERLLILLEQKDFAPKRGCDIYILTVGDKACEQAFKTVTQWRQAAPELRIMLHCGGGSFKSQFKKADKSGASVALILGDEEVEQGTVGVKFLREDREQQTLKQSEVMEKLMENWRK